jgi:hypothetical protein
MIRLEFLLEEPSIAKKFKNKAKFRNPDRCDASHELSKILPKFKKLTTSKTIPHYFTIDQNTSTSFNHFVSGLKRVIAQYTE